MSKIKVWMATVCVAALAVTILPGAASALPSGMRVQAYKQGLDFPVDMAWVPGTRRVFFTEKNTGKIRILTGRNLRDRACVNLDVDSSGESGALGITLHPRFRRNHWLYVYFTHRSNENRVVRFEVVDGRCTNRRPIISIPAGSDYHNGGQLEFVGNKLFISTGESHNPADAQNLNNRLGKVLRLKAGGQIPRGNPFNTAASRSAIWSYGHRNPFGLTHKPGTTRLYETENGPDCDDELNRIKKGRNYGWGAGYTCDGPAIGPNPVAPMWSWTPTVVPTDPWWYQGELDRLSGDLYVGDFRGHLHRFDLNRRGTRVQRHSIILNRDIDIVDVSKGPGGWLYYMTPSGIFRIVRD